MDPLITAVTTILGKYAIDQGATLIKEAGQAAANVAAKLFEKVIGRLKADPTDKKNAERFEQNPQGYQAPIADALDEQMKSDPNFAAELKQLLEEFEQSRVVSTTTTVTASHGAVAVGGNVSGNINVTTTTDDHRQTIHRSGGIDIHDSSVDVGGDLTGRDKISSE